MNKKQLGQFFTTNSNYILQGFEKYIKNKEIIDPFAGSGDLIFWAKKFQVRKISGFDFDKKYVDNKIIFFGDSLKEKREYKFILTNPPYLHKNKADKKTKKYFFENINFEDLYQISIYSILNSEEGILIVPLNFLSAENSKKIRKIFFEKFEIKKMNIFLEQVFEDTTYNVISFYYKKKKDILKKENIFAAKIFPENKKIQIELRREFNWEIGGEFLKKIKKINNDLGVFRLTEDYLKEGKNQIEVAIQNIRDLQKITLSKKQIEKLEKNILLLKAIDDKNGKKIQIEDIRKYNIKALVGKNTSRTFAHLIFEKDLTIQEQLDLMEKFNQELEKNRQRYYSLFLTNFRDNGRKRISFTFAYKLLNYIYQKNYEKEKPRLF